MAKIDPELIKQFKRKERERCAKVADKVASETADGDGEYYVAHQIADRIRALR